jgi:hypothetical protein
MGEMFIPLLRAAFCHVQIVSFRYRARGLSLNLQNSSDGLPSGRPSSFGAINRSWRRSRLRDSPPQRRYAVDGLGSLQRHRNYLHLSWCVKCPPPFAIGTCGALSGITGIERLCWLMAVDERALLIVDSLAPRRGGPAQFGARCAARDPCPRQRQHGSQT